jgi:hypothetical protein
MDADFLKAIEAERAKQESFQNAVAAEAAKQQKVVNGKLLNYRSIWFMFMVLVFAPAWFLASSVEGISFGLAVDVVHAGLEGLYFPGWLASLVSYPVTAMATLIPGSSRSAYWAVYMVFSSFSVVIFFVYFMLVEPPNYRRMKFEADPLWEEKLLVKYPVPSKLRPVSFSSMIVFLILSSLFGEVVSGYNRDPLADTYVGSIYLIDKNRNETPLRATIKLDMIDPGYIYDRKPGVNTRSWHIEFSGEDLPMLKSIGIDEKFFKGNVDFDGYGSVVCSASIGTAQYYVPSFLGGTILLIRNHYVNAPDRYSDYKCPENMHFGLENLNQGHFAIADISKKYIIAAKIERDSRFSWIQRKIMEYRYQKIGTNFFDRRNR